MNNTVILGVDIGGSHITSALVNVANGSFVENSWNRAKVDSHGTALEIIISWCRVIRRSLVCPEYSGKISIAMPGPFDYEKGISYMRGVGKYDALYGVDVKKLMLEELGGLVADIRFQNDAGCFLQGELAYGVAKGYQNVIGFTLGTGFGSAVGVDGKSTDTEYWQYPFMGGICEDYFSSRWFEKKYAEFSGRTVMNVKEMVETSDVANPLFQVFDEFSLNLGMLLAKIHKNTNFGCIVIGGNIAKASGFFLPQLQAYMNSRSISCPILISSQGENAAMIGAVNFA